MLSTFFSDDKIYLTLTQAYPTSKGLLDVYPFLEQVWIFDQKATNNP